MPFIRNIEQPMPIAVVGLSFRFPGGANSDEALWDMLANGRNAWSEVPKDRMNADAFYHPDNGRKGTVSATVDRCAFCHAGVTERLCNSSTSAERIFWKKTSRHSTPHSSQYPRMKPERWIPSSGCCWRQRMKPTRMVGPPCMQTSALSLGEVVDGVLQLEYG